MSKRTKPLPHLIGVAQIPDWAKRRFDRGEEDELTREEELELAGVYWLAGNQMRRNLGMPSAEESRDAV